ncbi:defense protein l(2)34Fc [Teleopsis dalmanni]|uniref:defense protein l(2)34Fc-like n=1 Tax=Teleopsis dalmanni TaxID=139649 RepID=UPI0018CE4396|nr:defense protein l(2)34Fc-like [Teleopsis dalmanni]XP_037959758.1 defense protein l(2)34Fc [Teleopsis dalmanni]
MFRFILIAVCLAVPVLSYSTGAPNKICTNGLTPEHHLEGQTSSPPYSFSAAQSVRAGDKLSITLSGDDFLGFAIQAQDSDNKPVGTFNPVDNHSSQTLTCSAPGDTLTHKKLAEPIKSLKIEWTAPQTKGKVRLVGTVAKNGATFWVRKVLLDVNVE